jgi:MFS family permease
MSITAEPVALPPGASFESAVFRKVSLRLLPFLFLLYVVNLIDRTNIAMASLQMVDELKILSVDAYQLGAGIFYVGYLIFEVPSNLILARIGARMWIARILVSWGLISMAMMFVTGPWSFYVLRVLLGAAEAGFFPGIIYYLNDWFPARMRARAISRFMIAGVVAGFVGSPLSGLILESLNGVGGMWGWKWVFLLEGIPAVLLGFVTLWYLTDRPSQARWLTESERQWLCQEIANDRSASGSRRCYSLRAAFVDPRVWLLIAIYFTIALGENSYGFNIPSFLKTQFASWHKDQIGLLVAVPGVVALIAMILVGRSSDRHGERRVHLACAALTAALGWLTIFLVSSHRLPIAAEDSRWVFLLGTVIALAGMKSMLPIFWTLPPVFLTGTAAAAGIALINSVANLGGMLGPIIFGRFKSTTNSFDGGYLVMAGALFVGGMLALTVRLRDPKRQATIAELREMLKKLERMQR